MTLRHLLFGVLTVVLPACGGSEAGVLEDPRDASADATPAKSDGGTPSPGPGAMACGWQADARSYTCRGSGEDPSKVNPLACPAGAKAGGECPGPSSSCCTAQGALGCICPDCIGCSCRWQRNDCF